MINSSPRIYSKDSLKQYILRRLGYPVITVEVTEDQMDDAIADTLDEFIPRAYSGVSERFIPMTIPAGITSIILPYDVFAVLSINTASMGGVGGSGASPTVNPFHINNFIAADLYKGSSKIDLITYELTFEMIETMNLMLSTKLTFDFNTYSKELVINEKQVNDTPVIIQVYRRLTPYEELRPDPTNPSVQVMTETTNIYDVKWVRRMAVEKTRYQWGVNLMKYEGSVLPNGGSLNSSGIMSLAQTELDKLMTELYNEHELPVDFFIG